MNSLTLYRFSRNSRKQAKQKILDYLTEVFGEEFDKCISLESLKSYYKPIVTPLHLELALNQSLQELANKQECIEKLQRSLEDAKRKAAAAQTLKQENSDLIERCRLLQEGIDEHEAARKAAESALAELKNSDANLQKIDDLESELAYSHMLETEYKKSHVELVACIKSLKCSVASTKHWAANYKKTIEANQRRFDQQLTEKQNEYDALVDKYNELVEATRPLQDSYESKERTISRLVAHTNELEDQLASLKQDYSDKLNYTKVLHDKFLSQQHELMDARRELECRMLRTEEEELRGDIERMVAVCDNYKSAVTALTSKVQELEAELAKKHTPSPIRPVTKISPPVRPADPQPKKREHRPWLTKIFEKL